MKALTIILFLTFNFALGAQNPSLIIQDGHHEEINTLSFHDNGNILASGGKDKIIKIWDIQKGKSYESLLGHQDEITALSFLPNSTQLVSGGGKKDPVIVFWDWKKREIIHKISGRRGVAIQQIVFNKEGTLMCAGGYQTLTLWRLSDKSKLWEIDASKNKIRHTINSILFLPDQKTIITGSQDQYIRYWSVDTGTLLKEISLKETQEKAMAMVLDKSGKYFYHAGSNSVISKREVGTGHLVEKFTNLGKGSPCPCTFDPDGNLFFNACSDDVQKVSTAEKIFRFSSSKWIEKAAAFSSNTSLLAIAIKDRDEHHKIHIYHTATGKRIKILEGYSGRITSVRFSADNQKIASGSSQTYPRIWDLNSALGFKNYDDGYQAKSGDIYAQVLFSPKDQQLLNSTQHLMQTWDIEQGKLVYKILSGGKNSKAMVLSPDSRYLVHNNQKVFVYEVGAGKEIVKLDGPALLTQCVAFHPDGKTLYAGGFKEIKRWKVDTWEELPAWQSTHYTYEMAFHPLGKYYIASQSGLGQFDAASGTLVKRIAKENEENLVISHDGNLLATSLDNKIYLRSTNDFSIRYTLLGHNDHISALDFSSDDRLLISGSKDTSIKIWDVKEGRLVATLIALDKEDFIITTPDLYYLTTKQGLRSVAFRMGEQIFPFEQFDLKYNRPDIVLERIGYANTPTIEALRRAYYKRIQRLDFDEGSFNTDFHLPEIRIVEKLPINTTQKHLEFHIDAQDEKYLLNRLQVRINDVPLYGLKGLNLADPSVQKVRKKITLELSYGINKIQVSVLNEKGVESLVETVEVNYNGSIPKPNLYLIALGVSEFQNGRMNLNYAAKDAEDVIQAFQDHALYEKVMVKKLINKEATLGNFVQLKELLKNTQVDDHVILFVATHGLLDQELNYYLATHDVNFAKPSDKGLPYEKLEHLLDGIPARNKLILVDACHSGELDKEEVIVSHQEKIEEGEVVFRKVSDNQLQYRSNMGLNNSFQLAKQLFSDLKKGVGATIIASAGGVEYALEGDQWKNGVFTYCFLKGLKSEQADLNHDEHIILSELQEFLHHQVYEMTDGKQQPTSRMENISNDFRVW